MKIATVCTGIGSPEKAIENLGIPHEIVFGCEIDKYARQTYLANFNPGFMVPDMTKESWEGEQFYSDLFIGGIPCQAFSLAGKRLGELDPRGLLFFDFYRYVKNQNPKYFIIENVKGLLSAKSQISYENTLYLLFNNIIKIEKWESLNTQKDSLNMLSQNISLYLLQNFAKKLNLKKDKSGTSFNIKWELGYEKLEQKAKSGLKRRLAFLGERIYQITKKQNFYPQELTVPLGLKEIDWVLSPKQSYLIENIIPKATSILERTVNISANTSLFANDILEDNSKNGKLYTTLTELNSTTDLRTFMYVLEMNIIRLIILALDLSPNLWKEIWLILTKKKEFTGLKTFDIWTSRLSNLNYNLHWQVLNTKDYGLPQNRERVFLIGIRNDLPNSFVFPKGVPLKLRLKDILEDEVDEKYYLSEKLIKGFISHTEKHKAKGNGFEFKPTDGNCVSKAITTRAGTRVDDNYIKIPSATASGYEIATEGDSINLEHPNSETRRGRVGKQVAQTLTTSCNKGVMVSTEIRTEEAKKQRRITGTNDFRGKQIIFKEQNYMNCLQTGLTNDHFIKTDYRIRKLTPKECFRLQGFPDEFLQNAIDAGVSNSQLYKQAGNSISVPVIQAILKNLCNT